MKSNMYLILEKEKTVHIFVIEATSIYSIASSLTPTPHNKLMVEHCGNTYFFYAGEVESVSMVKEIDYRPYNKKAITVYSEVEVNGKG